VIFLTGPATEPRAPLISLQSRLYIDLVSLAVPPPSSRHGSHFSGYRQRCNLPLLAGGILDNRDHIPCGWRRVAYAKHGPSLPGEPAGPIFCHASDQAASLRVEGNARGRRFTGRLSGVHYESEGVAMMSIEIMHVLL